MEKRLKKRLQKKTTTKRHQLPYFFCNADISLCICYVIAKVLKHWLVFRIVKNHCSILMLLKKLPSILGTILVKVLINASPLCVLLFEFTLLMIFCPPTISSRSPPCSLSCDRVCDLTTDTAFSGLWGGLLFVKTLDFCMDNQRCKCALSRSDKTPPGGVVLLLTSFVWLDSCCFFFDIGPFCFTLWCFRFRLWVSLFCAGFVLSRSGSLLTICYYIYI